MYLPLLFIPLGSVGSASCVTALGRNNKKDGEMFENGEGEPRMYTIKVESDEERCRTEFGGCFGLFESSLTVMHTHQH